MLEKIRKARNTTDLLEIIIGPCWDLLGKEQHKDLADAIMERAEEILGGEEPYTVIHRGSLLHTKDGRKIGNAIVWQIEATTLGLRYLCVSDFGNDFRMSHEEVCNAFFIGDTTDPVRWAADRRDSPKPEEPFITTHHFGGKSLPLSAVLFALASQEGNDGDEGNAMQLAGETLRKFFPDNVIFALEVGHYAEPATGDAELVSGCGRYDRAVVVSIDPFVLVSPAGDMVWTQQQAKNFKLGGVPTAEVLEKVRDRLRRSPEIGVSF